MDQVSVLTLEIYEYHRYFVMNEENLKVLSTQWDTFFMIFETMEEFSVHLIKPVWSQIFTLFPKRIGGIYLDSSWLELLLIQSFNHSNLGVQRMCLAAFYSLNFDTYMIFFDEKFACGT